MSTRWIHTSLGVMLAGAAVLWASGCASKAAAPQAAAGSVEISSFDGGTELLTPTEAEEMADAQIDERNVDAEFERLVSEIDGAYFGRP